MQALIRLQPRIADVSRTPRVWRNAPEGTRGEVQDPSSHKRATVDNTNGHGFAVIAIRYEKFRAERQRAVSRDHCVGVHSFTGSRSTPGVPVPVRAVEACSTAASDRMRRSGRSPDNPNGCQGGCNDFAHDDLAKDNDDSSVRG